MSLKNSLIEEKINKIYLWIGLSPLMLSLFFVLIILFFFPKLPSKLPLFYSLSWGDKILVNHEQFLILPAILILVTLINLTISSQLHSSQYFFKKILLISSFISGLILTLTFIKIILIYI